MSLGGLTDKKLRNKRFCKTEEAIFSAYFEGNERLASMRQVAKKAGISKSTLYRHHHSLEEIVPDYEEYIIKKYRAMVKRTIADRSVTAKTAARQLVIFVLVNKRIFRALFRSGKKDVISRIVGLWEVRIKKDQRMGEESQKLLNVYIGEVLGVIDDWLEKGLKEDEIGKVTGNIVYLTETIKQRLGRLI